MAANQSKSTILVQKIMNVFRVLAKSVTAIAAVMVCLTAVTGSVRPSQLEQIREMDKLTVVTLNSPLTYYEDRSGPTGYEYELVKGFAEHLGVELDILVVDNLENVFSTLETGKAAMAAASLAITAERQRWFRFGSPYMKVSELVVYRRGTSKPRSASDLSDGLLVVSSSSSHGETLRQIQNESMPELSWSEAPELEITELLGMVEAGDIQYTLVDSNEFNMLQAYYPNVGVGFALKKNQALSWAFMHNPDDSLYQASVEYFQQSTTKQLMTNLNERFYGHLSKLDYVGAKRFLRQTRNKLSTYKENFVSAAKEHGFDWRLLAAVGYQESHWNPRATSPTGVRGLMMLTQRTAGELGVEDRLDPAASIAGGSRYLAGLRRRLGADLNEPDRTWMALAAYNVGYGHLQDARRLTYEMGGDPNLWRDVKETLPLLAQKRYHKKTRYGYARGYEAVDYVQNIRRYYDVLIWNEEQQFQFQVAGQNGEKEGEVSATSMTVIPPLL